MYNKQMEMFQDGGLKDQGGSKDPVSGNDVPSGSLKEEVRDDIDAKLSPGEFVFPADVVRFIGLEKLMLMRDKAKKGLARMEEMGQMGNSDEATIDDDVPFGMEDLIIVAGSPDNDMSKGGVPSYGRGGVLLGFDSYVPPTTYYNPATGQEMTSTKIGGDFFPPLPKGFIEKPQKAEAKPRDVKTETTKVETEMGSGERDGGVSGSDTKSTAEMSPTELADFADFADRNPMTAKGMELFGNLGTDFMTTGGQMAVGAMQSALGVRGKGVTGQGTLDIQKAREAQFVRDIAPDMFSEMLDKADADAMKAARKSLSSYPDDVVKATISRSLGATGAQIAAHADAVSRGDRPPGSTATPTGYSTVSPTAPYGAVYELDPFTNEWEVSYEKTREAQKQAEKEKEQAEADQDRADKAEERSLEVGYDIQREVDPGTDDDEAPDPTGRGGTETIGEADVWNTGGLIPKPKKKKQKKKKRGGLASR